MDDQRLFGAALGVGEGAGDVLAEDAAALLRLFGGEVDWRDVRDVPGVEPDRGRSIRAVRTPADHPHPLHLQMPGQQLQADLDAVPTVLLVALEGLVLARPEMQGPGLVVFGAARMLEVAVLEVGAVELHDHQPAGFQQPAHLVQRRQIAAERGDPLQRTEGEHRARASVRQGRAALRIQDLQRLRLGDQAAALGQHGR